MANEFIFKMGKNIMRQHKNNVPLIKGTILYFKKLLQLTRSKMLHLKECKTEGTQSVRGLSCHVVLTFFKKNKGD